MTNTGRPEITEKQYENWLKDMSPFLKAGYSLYYAIEKTALSNHKDSIYRKYRLDDWFSEKVDAYQKYTGEVVNSVFSKLVERVEEKMIKKQDISTEEWRNLRFYAEHHKSCREYFINRREKPEVKGRDIALILDNLEEQSEAERQQKYAEDVNRQFKEEKQRLEKAVQEKLKTLSPELQAEIVPKP